MRFSIMRISDVIFCYVIKYKVKFMENCGWRMEMIIIFDDRKKKKLGYVIIFLGLFYRYMS